MKLKKLVALITAGTLCLGMSMTAFAADPSREAVKPAGATTSNGTELKVEALSQATLDQVQKDVTKILEDSGRGVLPAGAKAEVVVAADISLPDGESIPKEGLQIEVQMTEAQIDAHDIKVGDKFYILHQRSDGTWEVLNGYGTVDKNGKIIATVYGLSPIAFVKITSAGGQAITLVNDPQDPTKKAEAVTPVKQASPKTGE